jgi:hypothetical protein
MSKRRFERRHITGGSNHGVDGIQTTPIIRALPPRGQATSVRPETSLGMLPSKQKKNVDTPYPWQDPGKKNTQVIIKLLCANTLLALTRQPTSTRALFGRTLSGALRSTLQALRTHSSTGAKSRRSRPRSFQRMLPSCRAASCPAGNCPSVLPLHLDSRTRPPKRAQASTTSSASPTHSPPPPRPIKTFPTCGVRSTARASA